MKTVSDNAALRQQIKQWRDAGETIAFVPTMGNLHDGHLQLVDKAKSLADRCVASIFVNPMQFGEGEDFENYPRTHEADSEKLSCKGTDLLYMPSVETLYPAGQTLQTRVEVPGVSDVLCGESRPGHFVGVATIVCKLFNLVAPDVAIFGEKDFQQLLVIRRMTKDLCMPIDIVGFATVREKDGLARSSRNGYLTDEERIRAPRLYQIMQDIVSGMSQGKAFTGLESKGKQLLVDAGFEPDYLTIRRAFDLDLPKDGDTDLVLLAAAQLGRARLIDNISVQL